MMQLIFTKCLFENYSYLVDIFKKYNCDYEIVEDKFCNSYIIIDNINNIVLDEHDYKIIYGKMIHSNHNLSANLQSNIVYSFDTYVISKFTDIKFSEILHFSLGEKYVNINLNNRNKKRKIHEPNHPNTKLYNSKILYNEKNVYIVSRQCDKNGYQY